MPPTDHPWMLQALALAQRGRGHAEPNPLVGAVIVQNNQIVGEGFHEHFGQAHAEINALAAAGNAARGATLYVTLEPCCHHGKTPPCTGAIIQAGIQRVVAAMLDPFPAVAGKGLAQLQAAGIATEIGLCEPESRRLNAPYLTLLTKGRPHVHAKWAMTLDGKICTRTGDSKWISNEAARRRVHELRGRMDAIVVGIGTVLADDPLLTARSTSCQLVPPPRTATRIVLDSQGRLPVQSQLVKTAKDAPLMIATVENIVSTDPLRLAGCEVLTVNAEFGRPSVKALLQALGQRRMTNILVEGGSEVLGSFFDAGVVDEVWAFVAPAIVGGGGKSPVGGRGVEKIAEALRLAEWQIETVDDNVLLHAISGSPEGAAFNSQGR